MIISHKITVHQLFLGRGDYICKFDTHPLTGITNEGTLIFYGVGGGGLAGFDR